jgi:type I restriction enzyme S subunit
MRTIESVDPYFFNLYLNYLFATGYWKANCKQSVNQASVNQKDISKVKFCYPPLATQKKIVAKLDAIFAEIDKATAAAETNAKNSEALFQSYLTEVFERRYENNLLTTLGNYYDVRDGTHDSPKFHEKGYPLVTSKNLKNGVISFEKIQYVSKEDYLNISQRSGVKKGDVLMAMIGTIGNPVVIETNSEFAIKNVALFKTNDTQSPHFLRYYLGSDYVIRKMEKDAKGATQKFVGLGYLRSFAINIPPLNIQLSVVKELEEYEQHAKKLSTSYFNKAYQLINFKQSILKQAFNGELVKD